MEKISKKKIWYEFVWDELFPIVEEVINIKTGPTSLIPIAVYPSFEDAAGSLTGRKKMMEYLNLFLKDGFFHEGEVTYHYVKPSEKSNT